MAFISPLSFVSSTATPPSLSQFQSAKYRKAKRHHISKVASSSSSENQNTREGEELPHRRNVLLGLGAICGAAMSLNNNEAFAAPSRSPSTFPLVLDSAAVSAVVKRPSKSRSKKQKEEEEEVLLIEGIEFLGNTHAKFDVIVNAEQDYKLIRPDHTEFAGSFVSLPKSNNRNIVTSMSLGITDLLDDLGADDDESVVVTLVPRDGRVKIRAIKTLLLAD